VQLRKVPDYNNSSFNPEKLEDDKSPEPSEERRQLLKSAASDWNKVTFSLTSGTPPPPPPGGHIFHDGPVSNICFAHVCFPSP